jgi:hypothetical protein
LKVAANVRWAARGALVNVKVALALACGQLRAIALSIERASSDLMPALSSAALNGVSQSAREGIRDWVGMDEEDPARLLIVRRTWRRREKGRQTIELACSPSRRTIPEEGHPCGGTNGRTKKYKMTNSEVLRRRGARTRLFCVVSLSEKKRSKWRLEVFAKKRAFRRG